MTDLTGGCACGKVRYTAKGDPRFACICQCRDCQLLTGATHAAPFCHDPEMLIVRGELARHLRQTEAGHTVTQFRCAECGSPIYGLTTRAPAIAMVMAGTLDDPAAVAPDRIFFAESRIPWDHASVPDAG